VGRVYQQTVIDTYAKVAFAKLGACPRARRSRDPGDRKTPITAAEILNDRVVPFYDEHGIRLSRVLTDRGTEFCGSESHEYELYLAVEDIDHTRTKAKSPQTNGICERFHRTVLDEFYRVAFRKKIYRTIDELQVDLDAWIAEYNEQRSHQGRWCFGKTPLQTFLDALPLAKEKLMAA
jgi:transposase InsO family protein